MAQGFLLISPRLKFTDVNNNPLALGKLYGFAAGTSTPLTFYSNSDLSSTHNNPAILSASGEITVFLPSATLYKFDLYDANDVHQSGWPVDGVEAIPAPDPPAPTPSPVPAGGILAYGGTSAPSGYLLCDGALVSRATYSALFTAIGTAFGAGDGSTTFGLPDLRQRFPLGKATAGTGSTLGGTGGLIDHVHTGPSHTHTGPSHTHTIADHLHTIAHTHTVTRLGWGGIQIAGAGTLGHMLANDGVVANLTEATQDTTTSASSAANSGTTSLVTGASGDSATSAAGTGNTGTANAPFQSVNYIVKT